MSKRISTYFIIALLCMPLFVVNATEEQVASIESAVFFVDTVVHIDEDTRTLTLRSEEGEETSFTAGPEVRNLDQIKPGDLIMIQYFNTFAIAVGPKDGGLKTYSSLLEIENAKQAKESAARIIRTSNAEGVVEAIDSKQRLLTVKGLQQSTVFSVSEYIDLAKLIVGNEIEVIYIESYAIHVGPIPKVTGKVAISSTLVAAGIGMEWGKGELTMYDGSTYTFDIEGISVLDVGISLVEAKGNIYNTLNPKDIEGKYWAAEIGISYGDGVSALAMKNKNGVNLRLTSKQRGIRLTLAAEGLKIKNVMPAN